MVSGPVEAPPWSRHRVYLPLRFRMAGDWHKPNRVFAPQRGAFPGSPAGCFVSTVPCPQGHPNFRKMNRSEARLRRSGTAVGKHDIHPVIRVKGTIGREGGCSAVLINTVQAVPLGRTKDVQRPVIEAADREVVRVVSVPSGAEVGRGILEI